MQMPDGSRPRLQATTIGTFLPRPIRIWRDNSEPILI